MDINTGSEADRINNLELRVGQLEAALTQLHEQVNASFPPYGPPQAAAPAMAAVAATAAPDWMNQVRALQMQGEKIDAIRLYRQNTGVGLVEAKAAVEAMA